MNIYKKKPLKFSSEVLSRDFRHAETIKARESSRFKRLSMIRDINDSDFTSEEMEAEKSVEVHNVEKPTVSRLEMLFKWKLEKQQRKELEMKSKKKPFYAGRNPPVSKNLPNKTSFQSNKSSFLDQSKINSSASKVVASKLLPSKPPPQPSKIQNTSKQLTSISRIPSNCKQAASVPKVISKNEKAPVAKQISNGMKFTKGHGSLPRTVNQGSPLQRSVNKSDKTTVSKITCNAKSIPKINNSSLKASNQESSLPKTAISKLPNKTSQKVPTLRAKQTGCSTLSKLPKETCCTTKNITTRKGYCFKKAVVDTHKQQKDCKNASLKESQQISKEIKMKCSEEREEHPLSEKSVIDASAITVNLDISTINSSNSFAPANFQFKPPAELSEFLFDDDDPYEVLEQVKLKFMSRTSTPTKVPKKSLNLKCPVDPPCKESALSPVKFSVGEAEKNSSKPLKDSPCKDSTFTPLKSSAEEEPEKNSSSNSLKDSLCEDYALISSKSSAEGPEKNSSSNSLKDSAVTPLKSLAGIPESGSNSKCLIDSPCKDSAVISPKSSAEGPEESFTSKSLIGSPCKDYVCTPQKTSLLDIKNLPQKSVSMSAREDRSNGNLVRDNCETQPVNTMELSACSESPLDIIDLDEAAELFDENMELMKLGKEEIIGNQTFEEAACTKREKKRASYKRVSILKSISTLNSIAEVEDSSAQSPEECPKLNEKIITTPRHSQRLPSSLTCQHVDILKESIPEELPVTPRRSQRLLEKAITTNCEYENSPLLLPFEGRKSRPKTQVRRSMRLIDLNTPEKDTVQQGCSKTNLTLDFERLNLKDSENVDPNASLIDFDSSPLVAAGSKSRKVSLLYTPEKIKKGARKSIRGDLIDFSPLN